MTQVKEPSYRSVPADSLVNTSQRMKDKITYYHLALYLVLLPYDRFFSQAVLISLVLHCLLHLRKNSLAQITRNHFFLGALFFVSAAGIIWSPDKDQGISEATRQIPILLFPLIFGTSTPHLASHSKKLLIIFATGCAITVLILFGNALYILNYNHLAPRYLFSPSLINHNFSTVIGIHATYLSMYVALAIVIFLYYFFNEKKNNTRGLYIVATIILLGGLVQLASRSVLIATIIILATAFPVFVFKGSIKWGLVIISIVIASISLYGITRIDSFKKRYIAELKDDLVQASINNELLEPRVQRWHVAINLIKNSVITGYGSGSEKKVLKEQYFENKMYNSYLNQLNAHNQYLSFLLKTGVLGLIVFLVFLGAGFIRAIKNRDILFFSFMTIITMVSVSENILDVNKGIFFLAFFYPFFMLLSKPSARFKRLENTQVHKNT